MTGRFRSLLFSPRLYHIVRILLAALFIYGGGMKLLDPRAFARIISAYDLVPEILLPVVAVGLPLLETVAGIGLLCEIRGSLGVISALIGMFILILGYGIVRDLDVDCGCFGAAELDRRHGLVQAFWRDLALGGLVVPYLYLARRVLKDRGTNDHKEKSPEEFRKAPDLQKEDKKP